MSSFDDRYGADPEALAESRRLAALGGRGAKHAPEFPPERPAGYIIEGKYGSYFVRSRSADGVFWEVAGRTCSCPAGRAGHENCWHRRHVAEFVKRINEKMARPSVPSSPVGWFVD